MGFCSNILTGYMIIGSLYNMAMGIVIIVGGVVLNKVDGDATQINEKVQKYVGYGLYALGALCVFVGLMGIYAFWKKNKCFQSFFLMLNFFFLLVFAFLFGAFIYGQKYINEYKNYDCKDISSLQSANNFFVDNFKTQFCKKGSYLNQQCPCMIQNPSEWTTEELKNLQYFTNSGVINVQQCTEPHVQQLIQDNQDNVNLLKAVENYFNCSGICEGDVIYYFTDINRGPPESLDGCFPQIRDFVLDYAKKIFSFVIITTIFSFLNVIGVLILWEVSFYW